jgi:hypothetical protein
MLPTPFYNASILGSSRCATICWRNSQARLKPGAGAFFNLAMRLLLKMQAPRMILTWTSCDYLTRP